jgi:hypothetical protein
MKKFKCILGLHDWKYLNGITRQCMECGKLQYKKSSSWLWKWMNTDNYVQRGAKITLNKDTEIVTIKKGVIILECNGCQIVNDYTRVPSHLAKEVKQDIVIYPSEYQQKINECEAVYEN